MNLFIVGAGGHGREVADAAQQLAATGTALGNLQGFLDDDPDLRGELILGLPVLGSTNMLDSLSEPLGVLLGVGYPEDKRLIVESLRLDSRNCPELVHPSASVAGTTIVGHGSLIQAAAVLSTNVTVDQFVTVNVGATVSHDCCLSRYSTVSPGANLGGNVVVSEGAFVGIGAAVVQGVRIGEGSVIGAGAVVIADVEPHAVVAGVPARRIKTTKERRRRA